MEPNWAAQNLLTIRTLMERSALYRRALAPIMTTAGSLGIVAAIGGMILKIDSPKSFELYWLIVALVALGAVYILVRRQAIKDAEPFWSPPTRRVTQALLPPFAAGFVISIVVYISFTRTPFASLSETFKNVPLMWGLPIVWIILYGCALHAAGFFMPRGIRLFAWAFLLGGCVLFAIGIPDIPRGIYSHSVMGIFFGALQLAYGIYLYFTETRKTAA